jgi:flagellar hook-associated protein 2
MSTSSVTSGSMIDVNSIVNSLMQIEARPLQVVQTKISAANVSISAMGEVKSLVDSAFSAISSIEDQLALSSKSASVADGTVVKATVTASSLAGVGEITIEGTQTAAVQRSTFSGFASIETPMGFGNGSLTIDIAEGSSLLREGEDAVSMEFDIQGKSLAEVRDAINQEDSLQGKLRAVLVNTGIGESPWVLQLIGSKTGSLAAFSAVWAADDDVDGAITSPDGGATTGTGPLVDAAGTGANPTPDNARATINGIVIESQTNVFESAAPGVRLEVLKTSLTGTSVNVADSRGDLQTKIKRFASSFSDLLLKIKDATKPGSDSTKAGPLAGNSGVLGLSSRLFSAYVQGITLTDGRTWPNSDGTPALDFSGNPAPIRWSQLGLSVQRSGSVSIDESALAAALAGPLGESMLLGFTSSIRSTLDTFRGGGGSLSTTIQAMQSTVSSLRTDQDKIQDRMQRTRTSLVAKYAALDAKLSQMSQLSTNLKSALAGLSA